MLTLIASIVPSPVELGPQYAVRTVEPRDADALSQLYFTAYDAGDAAASIEEARDDIAATFADDYGPLWPEASSVVVTGGRIVAAAMVVHQTPWPDTPAGPFVVEIFTDRTHRRQGLARAVLSHAMRMSIDATDGTGTIGLRVIEDNAGARQLYARLGFRPWVHPRDRPSVRKHEGTTRHDDQREAGPGPNS